MLILSLALGVLVPSLDEYIAPYWYCIAAIWGLFFYFIPFHFYATGHDRFSWFTSVDFLDLHIGKGAAILVLRLLRVCLHVGVLGKGGRTGYFYWIWHNLPCTDSTCTIYF